MQSNHFLPCWNTFCNYSCGSSNINDKEKEERNMIQPQLQQQLIKSDRVHYNEVEMP